MLQDSLTNKEGKEDAEAYSELMRKGSELPDDEVAKIIQQSYDEVDARRNNSSAPDLSES
jgi:hypothetical protein